MAQVFLSVVIPAYNEESRISDTLDRVISFLSGRPYTWQVVVADDGSTDATGYLVGQVAALHSNVLVINLPHRGKGWAVKNAMLEASGQYRLLCDADLSVDIEAVDRFLPPKIDSVDIAVGSREAPGARRIGEPARRHFMGRIYNALVRLLAIPGLGDTQCGFKCFRGEVVPRLFQRQTMNGFAFDVEILFLASKDGLNVREIPVDWYYGQRSKVRAFRDSIAMAIDLLKIRWRYYRGRYRTNPSQEQVETGRH